MNESQDKRRGFLIWQQIAQDPVARAEGIRMAKEEIRAAEEEARATHVKLLEELEALQEERKAAQEDARAAEENIRLVREKGKRSGRIQLLQQLLEQVETPSEELGRWSEGKLVQLEDSLKRKLDAPGEANGTPTQDGK